MRTALEKEKSKGIAENARDSLKESRPTGGQRREENRSLGPNSTEKEGLREACFAKRGLGGQDIDNEGRKGVRQIHRP